MISSKPLSPLRLGINLDHVATLRNARGGLYPDLTRAAEAAMAAGADNLTAHLREDRRHIRDQDIADLVRLPIPLNMEMAVTDEMLENALSYKPHDCCLVPERREELTTEGGLDAAGKGDGLANFVADLKSAGIRVSLFIDPEPRQIEAALACHSDAVEFHTGTYCEAGFAGDRGKERDELARLIEAAALAAAEGLEVHAGHGLTYANVEPVAAIPQVVELNIGHFLVSEALFVGLERSIEMMRAFMDKGRAQAAHGAHLAEDAT